MFDPPSNLPLEPLPNPSKAQPAPSEVTAPRASSPSPAPKMPSMAEPSVPKSTEPMRKEPEDIFADIESHEPQEGRLSSTAPEAPRRHGSPIKMILIIVIILAVVGGIGWAVWTFFIKPTAAPVVVTTTASQPLPTTIPTQSEPIVEIPPSIPQEPTTSAPVTTPPPGTNIPIPQEPTSTPTPAVSTPVITEGIDSDGDGLTDSEEAIFGTDSTLVDTDSDGYPDGAEVRNEYDPAVAKASLVNSGRFRLATVGSIWSVRIPAGWTMGSDVSSPGDYALQTGTPATFSFHMDQKPAEQPFTDWLAANEPTVTPTDLTPFTTKAGNQAWQSADRLTTYLVNGSNVLVFRYVPNGASSYDFRMIADLLIQTIVVQ